MDLIELYTGGKLRNKLSQKKKKSEMKISVSKWFPVDFN